MKSGEYRTAEIAAEDRNNPLKLLGLFGIDSTRMLDNFVLTNQNSPLAKKESHPRLVHVKSIPEPANVAIPNSGNWLTMRTIQ